MSNEPSQPDTQKNEPAESTGNSRAVLIPSLILIGSQIPLSVVYLLNLAGSREHYKLFPVALLVVAVLLVMRWPRGEERPFFPSILSMVLLVCGLALAVTGTLLLSPWLGFASLVAFTGSLFARTNDRSRFGTLVSLFVPLLVLVQPPGGVDFDNVQGDIQLMASINSWSASIASDVFDVLSSPLFKNEYVNLVAGSRIEVPGGSVDTIDIGTRGGSVFSLLIATALFIAIMRRPLFRALALLVACVFWATIGEAFHVVVCVIGASAMGMNWLDNAEPMSVRFTILLFSFAMTLLSDHLIAFLFGKVEMTSIDEDMKGQFWLCQTWNFAVAGVETPVIDVNVRREVAWANWRNSEPTANTARFLWIVAMACSALAVFQVVEIGRASSLAGSHALQQGNGDWVEISNELLPGTLSGADLLGSNVSVPAQKTSFRVFENTWTFSDASLPEIKYEISVSQAWPGWHDAIADHLRDEWLLSDSQGSDGSVVTPEPIQGVPVVVADFHNTIAETGMLAFCQLDAFGEPFERPLLWADVPDFLRRAAHRMGNRIRPRIFVPDSILIEIKVHTVGEVPESVRNRALELLVAATEIIRARIIENQLPTGSVDNTSPPVEEPASPIEAAGQHSVKDHLVQLIQK